MRNSQPFRNEISLGIYLMLSTFFQLKLNDNSFGKKKKKQQIKVTFTMFYTKLMLKVASYMYT